MILRKGVHGPLAKSGHSPPPELIYNPPPEGELNVLFMDQDIIVVSKPAGLLSVPGNRPELSDCLESRVRKKHPTATTVHRLDRATSGICVLALNRLAHRNLGIQFEKRKTIKSYVAVVHGMVSGQKGEIRQALRTDWYNRPKQMIDNCLGREAVTQWSVLERNVGTTTMALIPVTGRSHQLRVHMQWLGHPIVGDEFYAPQESKMAERLMLQARSLAFFHPRTNEWLRFCEPRIF